MEKNIRKIVLIIGLLLFALGMRFLFEFVYSLVWEYYDFSTVLGFSLRFLYIFVFAIIWFVIALRSESPQHKLPWVLLLLLEPMIGLTLFLSLGRNFKNSRRYKKRPLMHEDRYVLREAKPHDKVLDLAGYKESIRELFHSAHHQSYHQPFNNDTTTEIFRNGETFYPDLMRSIEEAEKFILFEFFIIRSDERGKEIMNLLMAKAEEGIDVKVIMDGLGSNNKMAYRYKQILKKSKIDFVINDKIYFPLFNTKVNYRNHRKIVVVDGKIGYTGGMNIGNEYDNRIESDYYFRDTQIKLVGRAVKSLTALFFKDYYYNTNQFINHDFYYPEFSKKANGIVQIVQSGPDSNHAQIRDIYIKMFMMARKSIKIMTPYMALDVETLSALRIAANSGIDVEVIVPGIPDKYLIYKVTKFYITSLLEEGIKVYTYDLGFAHAKVLIVDDEVASVGSYNLDNRSAVIDFEVTALIYNDSVQTLSKQFEEDKQDSTLKDLKTWKKRNVITRLIEGVLSIFTPII